ncbi:MAG: sulfur carrier protein ThiS [Candidatus Omnitrophica bacterium]|nr:sulfur carrier protein ThiS [Candidatus Omnitrophota bacterium]
MNITLNGKLKEFLPALNLKSAVEQFRKDKTPVVAELNGEIIKLPRWEETTLKEGDIVELVSFVGGG